MAAQPITQLLPNRFLKEQADETRIHPPMSRICPFAASANARAAEDAGFASFWLADYPQNFYD